MLGAVGKNTLEEAFTYLKERLDPEQDAFQTAAIFRYVAWSSVEPVQDFRAYSHKICLRLMVSQTPP